ncbi:beta-1,4-galactosyltransferase 3-like [Protopterus annectens]|uniref:beta-1,4-galactosyltransferase 3-like n=1 Tax=Protopterus annectens TaxID=7888 RepID=UPI001CFC0EB6|nr:beta-1,4-galactosyltransferase 3-like [Protopterus annectens]
MALMTERTLVLLICVQLLVLVLLYQVSYDHETAHYENTFWKSIAIATKINKAIRAVSHYKQKLPDCPRTSQLTGGPLNISFPLWLNMKQVEQKHLLVRRGGSYSPPNCTATYKIAIIIPHRNRMEHLTYLLYHLHPFLQRQQLKYRIFVIEQAGNYTFNRGKLLNVGFKEAMKHENWDCIFFHDVDLIPEDDRNTYICDLFPKHASIAMDKFKYRLPYKHFFGGVSALTPEHVEKINGFPNSYWGWGGEDDDIATRIKLNKMLVARPPIHIGRYKMISHKRDKGNEKNPERFQLLKNATLRWEEDGLNNLEYILLSKKNNHLYTNITVDIGTSKGLQLYR